MAKDRLVSATNITLALLGMPVDGAMNDIPVFCLASTQMWLAYHCSKKLIMVLLSLISDGFLSSPAGDQQCYRVTVAQCQPAACACRPLYYLICGHEINLGNRWYLELSSSADPLPGKDNQFQEMISRSLSSAKSK
jgi:hypothetical protein